MPANKSLVRDSKGGGNGLACTSLAQVPRDHEEVIRLEGRYKNQGGLKEGMVVELANGAPQQWLPRCRRQPCA